MKRWKPQHDDPYAPRACAKCGTLVAGEMALLQASTWEGIVLPAKESTRQAFPTKINILERCSP